MDATTKAIWRKLRIRADDCLPYHSRSADRGTLADLFADLGFKYGAEIGTENGRYARQLCHRNPGLKLLCVDPYADYYSHRQEEMEQAFQNARKVLEDYNVAFIRMTSLEAAKLIPDAVFDFVYIDALHDFDNCVQDIIAWNPKVKRGGIVAGHDYHHRYRYGVVGAVDSYARFHKINAYYITGEALDPSWLWVR